MDRFDAMQAFARVVETGSFTKAADTLQISRTSVTQQVQYLEARLRVTLLNRTTRKVNVTADGAAYYERVIKLLAELDDAETSLSNAAVLPRGRLRVDVPSPFARMMLIPALPAFHAKHPDIQLEMGVSDRMVDIIGERVDCVVRGGELADLSLMARRVGELTMGFMQPPVTWKKRVFRRILKRCRRLRIILWGFGRCVRESLLRACCTGAVSVFRHKAATSFRSMMAMPAWLRAWRGWGSSASLITLPRGIWRAASWYACSRIGTSRPCRCTSLFPPTDTSAPNCAYSSIGWSKSWRSSACVGAGAIGCLYKYARLS